MHIDVYLKKNSKLKTNISASPPNSLIEQIEAKKLIN